MYSIAAHTASRFPYDFGGNISKPVTRDREIELAIKAQTGDDSAINKLIEANLRFVVVITKKYHQKSLEFIISDGMVGLMHAVKKYDVKRNVKFVTYAQWRIRQSILDSADNGMIVNMPVICNQTNSYSSIQVN